MPFLQTSARTAENVEAAFIRMADELIRAKWVLLVALADASTKSGCTLSRFVLVRAILSCHAVC
jgi:hypothetical protein